MSVDSVSVTCTSPVNIAVIKYWGKRDEKLILPLNSSLSGTLNQDDLKTTTTITASKSFKEDEIWLNGKKEDINNKRIQQVLKEIRSRAGDHKDKNGKVLVSKDEWSQYKVHIVSVNNFPTAAGLASSASGYCCLVFTLAQIYGVSGDISGIARLGSGSACRSMYGGWVAWDMGSKADGSDSMARQVQPETHWPEIQILVFVVNDKKKETSSTDGMQKSVETSKLMKIRADEIVPKRMEQMEKAITERDYHTFAELTMVDSDDFHAVCADTTPPIYYLNDISKRVIKIVRTFNEYSKEMKAAYTFDAGPNAVLYLPKQNIVPLLALALHYFPPVSSPAESFIKNPELLKQAQNFVIPKELLAAIDLTPVQDGLKYVLYTSVGSGPQVLPESASLIEPSTGLPKAKM